MIAVKFRRRIKPLIWEITSYSPQVDMLSEKNPEMPLRQRRSKYREFERNKLICFFDYSRLNSSIVKEMGNEIRFD